MVAIDWLILVVNQEISERDHFVSNEFFPAKNWLLIYNHKDKENLNFQQKICDTLFNVRISQYETLTCNWHDYFDVLFKFNKWITDRKIDKKATFGINGVTNAISAVNAIRDTIAREECSGFVFSFRKGLNNLAYGKPVFTPLNTNTLTNEHLRIIKVLMNQNRYINSQNELLEQLIKTDDKYKKYTNDKEKGKRVISYYIKQLEHMFIINIERHGRKKAIKLL